MLINIARIPIKKIIFIGLLPFFIKRVIYWLKGYDLGKKVTIGIGSVIIGKNVTIGPHTKIGYFTIIRGNNIKIGSHVSIRSTTFLDTPDLEIGDNTTINEQVFIGGIELPESKLKVGKNCTIMQLTYINCANPVVIGDDTGIGGHCLIFTHSSWLSQFEGYPVKFGSIQIGNSVWLPWRVFVMPGAKIGDGSVIAANSLVAGEIPSKCLAAGSPAKIIRKAPDFPKHLSEGEKRNLLKDILTEMIRYLEFYGILSTQNSNVYEFKESRSHWFFPKRKIWRMSVFFDNGLRDGGKSTGDRLDVCLSLKAIPENVRQGLRSKNCMWIDIEGKQRSDFGNDLGEEVARFLKRYGVRLSYIND
ncbi:MAG: hypothetical protein ACFFCW_13430 [Candidatus Hodarchaeota archaeon]